MCHAPSTAAGTSSCRSWPSFVVSRLISSLESGTCVSEAVRQGETEVVIGLPFVDVPDEARSWQMSTPLANGRVDAQWDSVVSEAWFSRRLPCRESAPRVQLLNLDALVKRHTAFDLRWCASCHHCRTCEFGAVSISSCGKRLHELRVPMS